jgi:hypothetical protein
MDGCGLGCFMQTLLPTQTTVAETTVLLLIAMLHAGGWLPNEALEVSTSGSEFTLPTPVLTLPPAEQTLPVSAQRFTPAPI